MFAGAILTDFAIFAVIIGAAFVRGARRHAAAILTNLFIGTILVLLAFVGRIDIFFWGAFARFAFQSVGADIFRVTGFAFVHHIGAGAVRKADIRFTL